MTVTVNITEQMRSLAEREAKRRKEFKRSYSPERSRTGKGDPMDNEILGILGEIVVGEYLGLQPDFSLYEGTGDAGDFEYKGKIIDVKTTNHPNARRLILFIDDPVRHPDIDIYVAVKIQDDKAYIHGWADTPMFRRMFVPKSGPRLVVFFDELNGMDTL